MNNNRTRADAAYDINERKELITNQIPDGRVPVVLQHGYVVES